MSEYQYYEFLAIDRPLTKKQIDEVGEWSTRAKITSTRFVNEYHYGDFRGDPELLVSEYFDVMVYFANWGTHRLLMNLPVENAKELKKYENDFLTIYKKRDRVLVDFCSDPEESDDWDTHGGGLMASLSPIRAEIAGGDLRPLFLGWLSGLYIEEEEDDGPVPPIPEGLEKLTKAQKRLAGYLRVDDDIIAAAAQHSGPSQPPTISLEQWIERLPEGQKNSFIESTISGRNPAAVASLRRRYQLESAAPKADAEARGMTVARLLAGARNLRQERESGMRGKRKGKR